MCVLNVKGDYVGLTLCVWHTDFNHVTSPFFNVAGKDKVYAFGGVSGGGMMGNRKKRRSYRSDKRKEGR